MGHEACLPQLSPDEFLLLELEHPCLISRAAAVRDLLGRLCPRSRQGASPAAATREQQATSALRQSVLQQRQLTAAGGQLLAARLPIAANGTDVVP